MWICCNCGNSGIEKFVEEVLFDKLGNEIEEINKEYSCKYCDAIGIDLIDIADWVEEK